MNILNRLDEMIEAHTRPSCGCRTTSGSTYCSQCAERHVFVDAKSEIERLMAELTDAKNYAAEISQGITHCPHEEGEPCMRCEAERRLDIIHRSQRLLSVCEFDEPTDLADLARINEVE